MSNKKGFTLIEVIIVIVILGILATLAVPRLVAQLETARGAEAVNLMGPIHRAALDCYDAGVGGSQTFANCLGWGLLNMSSPNSTLFTYSFFPGATATEFRAVAYRSGTAPTDCVKMQVFSDGKVGMVGMGNLATVVTRTGVSVPGNTSASCANGAY